MDSLLNQNIEIDAEDDLPATQLVDDRILKDVVAYVEVRSTNDNRSEAVGRELSKLGATVVKKFTSDVTHVIFKEGCKRTRTKAEKKGIHLVSVLWVENCRLNQEHVSERMYPAVVPQLKGTSLFVTKLKKAKSMQPRDFREELANSAERARRKKKKLEAINRLQSTDSTPSSSPRPYVLVQDTQPRSPDDEFILTPIRSTVPDTPPSMREKLRLLREAREGDVDPDATDELPDVALEEKHLQLRLLQKKLFKSATYSDDDSSITHSPKTNSVFMSDSDDETVQEVGGSSIKDNNTTNNRQHTHNVSVDSESSVNNDILKIAENINTTLSTQKNTEVAQRTMFGEDSDENLLNSQEIKTVVNIPVRLKTKPAEPVNDNIDEAVASTDKAVYTSINDKRSKTKRKNGNSNDKSEENEPDNKQRRRSSRRLSIQQAIQALDKSSILDKLPEKDEDENPIPDLTASDNISSLDNESKSEKSKTGKSKSKKGGRKSSPRLSAGKQNDQTSDVIDGYQDNSDLLLENGAKAKSESDISVEQRKQNSPKTAKGKRTMKKKLMSLTDLMEQHSVLIEPTKCSQIERPQLRPSDGQKAKRRKAAATDNASCSDSVETEMDATAKKTGNVEDHEKQSKSERAGKGRGKTRKSNEDKAMSGVSDTNGKGRDSENPGKKRNTEKGGKRRNTYTGEKGKKGMKTLVNETHVESDVSKVSIDNGQSPMAKIQDVTTQLNLTKDNGLMCSIRETTLSLSMSTAYTDTNMPSFLKSHRKSIDEFSASQRKKAKQTAKNRSTLSSISEKENVGAVSPEDSFGGITSNKSRSKLGSSQNRKLIRPSVVMTSLHSYEQDVVISVVKKLGGFVIAENVNETTTHVICGEPRRTLNVLYCLARGIWLVTKEWVIKSLEAGHWIPEAEFEFTSAFPECKTARLEHEKNHGPFIPCLFSSIGPVYISGRSQPPRQHLVQLLKLCGGQVTGVREKASIYIGSDYHPGMTCVKTNWLLDCITNQELLPMDRFYLDRPKRESSPAY